MFLPARGIYSVLQMTMAVLLAIQSVTLSAVGLVQGMDLVGSAYTFLQDPHKEKYKTPIGPSSYETMVTFSSN